MLVGCLCGALPSAYADAAQGASTTRATQSARVQLSKRGATRFWSTKELLALHVAYDPFIREAASLYQIPVALLQAVIRVESGYDRHAVSRKAGAEGLMQLMPFNSRRLGVDPFDPRQAVLAGARLLRELANRWSGNLVLTLASYNAGAGAVEKYGGVPPFRETRGYITRVLRHYRAYRQGRLLRRR